MNKITSKRSGWSIPMLASIGLILLSVRFAVGQSHNAPPQPPPTDQPQGNSQHQHAAALATRALPALAAGEKRLAISFENGHDTDPRDHGRPVRLIAAALNVPENIFRETFTHVHPAGPGSGGPTDAEARQNKSALMAGLSPYGVTNDRLNTVSNYYRYMKRNPDDLWQHRDAIAFVVVKNNKFVRFDIADSGAGYTTPPTVEIEKLPDVKVTVQLLFGTDLTSNGSLKSLAVATPAEDSSKP